MADRTAAWQKPTGRSQLKDDAAIWLLAIQARWRAGRGLRAHQAPRILANYYTVIGRAFDRDHWAVVERLEAAVPRKSEDGASPKSASGNSTQEVNS